ncbi:MAG: metallophosphoesterase family protein [Bacteroidetes bacterium]|nr:metallophosphoesterase family protein [Bacteroidota bacterium]
MEKPAICLYRIALLLFFSFVFNETVFSQVTLVPYGSSWKYLDNGTNQGTAWQGTSFNDASWASGNAELGYGDGDEATIVSYGGNASTKYITTYFRKTITIADPTVYSSFTLNVERDDGCIVYINGTEITPRESNMPASAITYTTPAVAAIEDAVVSYTIPNTSFVAGNNVIAIEVHQANVTSSDISFNAQLIGNDLFTASLTRGPYLQMGSQTAITIRWRTSTSSNSRVEIGTSFGTYTTVFSDASSVTEHIIRVTGLTADTKYWYRIGNSSNMGASDPDKFFTTVPPANTTRKVRIVAFGDCGRGNTTYQDQNLANYISYLSTNNIDAPDAWLLLGDNAYSTGSDAEYTNNFFGIYGNNILKNHKLYSAPGNHDYANNTANKASRTMPYYSNFTTPQNAECGGIASNKPNYYSYDIGNIHFLSLDSWGTESDASHMGLAISAIKTWVTSDLAANTKKWVIAYWHHGGYTKGSHDSDGESELVNIRQNFATFLESKGVDMIICGHSHVYERSYLLHNFTGAWNTFNAATHAVSTSSANYASSSTCPYVYNTTATNHGTVYLTAGSTGASTGSTFANFGGYAFPYSVNDGGVFYFEVDDNRLDAKMLRRNGTVFDNFTIIKDVNKTNSQTVTVGTPVTMKASWPGNYSWSTAATTRSITVTPSAPGTTNYTVTDNFGCITDQFSITASAILPVSLVDYNAILKGGKVDLNWTTSSENNSKYFTVERTQNQASFETVGRIKAAGQSISDKHYALTDFHPQTGVSYYRLSQTDVDGKTVFYDLKKIINNMPVFTARQLTGENGILVLQINSPKTDRVKIRVFDLSGKEIWKEDLIINAGAIQKAIILRRGAYVWEVRNSQGEMVSKIGILK